MGFFEGRIDLKETIMLVDDEKEIINLLEIYLKSDGYEIKKFYNGSDALAYLEKEEPDLAVLDVMLPDIDGFELCNRIRKRYLFPILMLTARVEDHDMLTGFTLGADDYITKPFKPIEVVARIKSQLRRYIKYNLKEKREDILDIRGLQINKSNHKTLLYGKELPLTPLEFSILYYLCKHQGEVVSSEKLFEEVWGEKFLDQNNTVMTHIGRIREKMHESARKPKFIKTVWGVGYQIE